jgi:hypothetical protein
MEAPKESESFVMFGSNDIFEKKLDCAERMHASRLVRGVSTPDRGWNFK